MIQNCYYVGYVRVINSIVLIFYILGAIFAHIFFSHKPLIIYVLINFNYLCPLELNIENADK